MKNMNRIFILCGFILLTLNAIAQQGEVEGTLSTMKSQIVKKTAITVNDKSIYLAGNETYVLNIMQRWLGDSLSDVRSNAVVITGRIASFTKDQSPRTKAMDMLFKACEDKNTGISTDAVEYLMQINSKYFTPTHKAAVGLFLHLNQKSLANYFYLAGYMYAADHSNTIENLISTGKLKQKELWQAHLALARLGNKNSMNECNQIVNSIPLGNDFIKVVVPGIIYTRQKFCVDVLVKMLKNNEKACIPSNPNYTEPIPCRYRIVEALAAVIDGFPEKVTAEGDLVTNDYDKALQTSIKWFDAHSDYKFVEEK